MSTKTRLANKTIWALEDIIALTIETRETFRKIKVRALRQMDAVMLASLATLSDQLAEIESKARDARQGEYRQR